MGRAKATLTVGGAPWAERTAALLSEVARPVIEVGPGYTGLVHVQESPVGEGPLAGVAAGWEALAGPEALAGRGAVGAVLVVATDLPRLTGGLLDLLASHPGPGCIGPLDDGGRPQPLCARYPARVLARATALVSGGTRALQALLEGEEVTWLPPEVWGPAAGRGDALSDVDTPAELARLSASGSGPS